MARKANEEKYTEHSKENLKRHLTIKFRTTMIGSLARFEEMFGHLWGHGLYEDELTEDQLRYRQTWELVRTEVLNNGNNQLRAALSEVDMHTIKYNKMEYKFIVQKKPQE